MELSGFEVNERFLRDGLEGLLERACSDREAGCAPPFYSAISRYVRRPDDNIDDMRVELRQPLAGYLSPFYDTMEARARRTRTMCWVAVPGWLGIGLGSESPIAIALSIVSLAGVCNTQNYIKKLTTERAAFEAEVKMCYDALDQPQFKRLFNYALAPYKDKLGGIAPP